MYKVIIALFLSLASVTAHAQPDWKLKKDEDGIRAYTATNTNSAVKLLKVECTVEASLSQLLAFLLDIDKQPEWVYNTRVSKVIKTVSPNELVFYSEVEVPWPCSKRDYVAHFAISQPGNNMTNIDSKVDTGMIPHKKGFVRVEKSIAHWDITPLNNKELKIVYMLNFDPAGLVPAWLVNMFLTKGPVYTFKKLREAVKKPQYQNAQLPFLKYGA